MQPGKGQLMMRDRPRRIFRLRQDDHPADDQPNGRADLRHRPGRRQGRDPPGRHRVAGDRGPGRRHLIPSRHIVPLIGDRKADDTVRKALAELGNVLTTEQLTRLNSRVDNDKKDPEDLAAAYAEQHGLV